MDDSGYLEINDTSSASPALQDNGHTTQLLRKANVAMIVCSPAPTSLRNVYQVSVLRYYILPMSSLIMILQPTALEITHIIEEATEDRLAEHL